MDAKSYKKSTGFMPQRIRLGKAPSSYGVRALQQKSRLSLEKIWEQAVEAKTQNDTLEPLVPSRISNQ